VTYAYDSLNRIVQVSYGDGRIIFYNYDAGGNLVNIAVQ
jgi:YD repeat-containing protein